LQVVKNHHLYSFAKQMDNKVFICQTDGQPF
jgi:hypothetical protein